MLSGNLNPFLGIFNMVAREKSGPTFFKAFPVNVSSYDVRTVQFSRLLNSDWLIQISEATAECKAVLREILVPK